MSQRQKPSRPAEFPLYAHKSGYWAKNIRGKTFYFGKWEEKELAMTNYLRDRDYLKLGVAPPKPGMSVVDLLDDFLVSRLPDLETGELSYNTWDNYRKVCKLICDQFGGMAVQHMNPTDFQKIRQFLATDVGAVTLAGRVRCARVAFRHLEVLTGALPKWGTSFREPSCRTMRAARAEAGPKMYTAAEIKGFIEAAGERQLKAMILLGINCAFGNGDCAALPWSRVDMKNGWHTFARPKTGVARRAKLWPETLEALSRISTPSDGLVFITQKGNPWIQEMTKESCRIDAIACASCEIGLKFYSLRRTFRTIADATLDRQAVRHVMGHIASNSDMDSVYIQNIQDDRLEKVSTYVHDWLFT